MKDLERVATYGKYFTIEWYYDERGRSRAHDYYLSLPEDRRDAVLILFVRFVETGRIYDQSRFRAEGDGIFAFKSQQDRFLCFFAPNRKVVVSNAYMKKSQKMPREEKERAERSERDYEKRVREGCYYD